MLVSATSARLIIPNVPMRVNPTATYSGSIQVITTSSYNVSGILFQGQTAAGIQVSFAVTGATNGAVCFIKLMYAGDYIDLNSEL